MSVSRETLPASLLESVSRETLQRLEVFADLLLSWNARINLISQGDVPHLWSRHIGDSLQLVDLMPPNVGRVIDLGSGAGFPGLILAIATNVPFALIESDQRKAAFLREAARQTGAPVTVRACRIDAAQVEPAALVTARALAPLADLLGWIRPLLLPHGACLLPKGRSVEKEIEIAQRTWTMRLERHISRIDRSGVILRISEIAPA